MVGIERTTVETLGDGHVLGQGVLDHHVRPVAVVTSEDHMRDRGAGAGVATPCRVRYTDRATKVGRAMILRRSGAPSQEVRH